MLCLCTDVEPWIPEVKLCKSTLIILNRINAIKNCVHHTKGRLISVVDVVITPMNPYQPRAEKEKILRGMIDLVKRHLFILINKKISI